jgi:glycosyltransferase involved in cell wall biosynthesis
MFINNTNKRACFLTPLSFDPPHSFTLSIARILVNNGFMVTIIGTENNRLPQKELLEENVEIIRVRKNGVYYSPFTSILNPLTILAMYLKALKQKASIYWCHGYGMIPIMLALKISGKRVIYDIGDDDPSNYSDVIAKCLHCSFFASIMEKAFRLLEQFVVSKVDYVITLTDSLKKDRSNYTSDIKSIYYCVDSLFNPCNTCSSLIDKYKNYNVIVYSGTISSKKGINEILTAFDIIKEQVNNAFLMIIGGPSLTCTGYINRIKNISDDILVTGWLPFDEMPKYICLAKVGLALVKPANYSYQISIPFKLLEQMACGLPVIAPKGLPEVERIVLSAECGILVDINRPEEIANAVIKLLRNEDLRITMGENAYNYIREHHNLELMEQEFMEVCNFVLTK